MRTDARVLVFLGAIAVACTDNSNLAADAAQGEDVARVDRSVDDVISENTADHEVSVEPRDASPDLIADAVERDLQAGDVALDASDVVAVDVDAADVVAVDVVAADVVARSTVSAVCLGCATEACVSEGAACLGDAVCVRCVNTDRSDPSCESNFAWRRFRACSCGACAGTCAAECRGVSIDAGAPTDAGAPADAGPPLDARTDATLDADAPDGARDVPVVDTGNIDLACLNCATTACGGVGVACLNDPECAACINEDFRGPRCASNPRWQVVLSCSCSACGSDCAGLCGGVRVDAGAAVDVAPVDSGTSVPTECSACAAGPCNPEIFACLGDPVCARCANTNLLGPGCAENPALQRLFRCGCTSCGATCPAACSFPM